MTDPRPNSDDGQGRLAISLRTTVDWAVLTVQVAAGACGSCGLPPWAADRQFKVPSAAGWFCSILCVECALFGLGRCRWCGKILDTRGQRFCDDACRHKSNAVAFGSGIRLLNFIARFHPHLYCQVAGQRRCRYCGDPLVGKQAGARFCRDRCRKAHRRAAESATSPKSGQRADTASQNQRLAECRFSAEPLGLPRPFETHSRTKRASRGDCV